MAKRLQEQNALGSFPCRGCPSVFKSGGGLLRHIRQTDCNKQYESHLKQTLDHQYAHQDAAAAAADDSSLDSGFGVGHDDGSLDEGWLDNVEEHHRQPVPSNKDLRIEVALLNIMKDIGAPLVAFKRIMTWAANARAQGYHFTPSRQDYTTQVKFLSDLVNMEDLRPTENVVVLEGHQQPAITISFDFKAHLKSLLNDPILNATVNLVVNPANPFHPYSSPDKRLGEILTGSWYRHAVKTMVLDRDKQFCCPPSSRHR